MRPAVMAAMACTLLMLPAAAGAQDEFPALSKRVPHLTQRLRSTRWKARYHLLHELNGRDLETKRALETLAGDEHDLVANQALVRYVTSFVAIDKARFRPAVYAGNKFPMDALPEEDADRALLDYCLARREIAPRKPSRHGPVESQILPVLDAERLDDPRVYQTLTIVGILGQPEDAKAVHPFLRSPNDYVALGAAKAVIRLGDEAAGVGALVRLTEQDPSQHLFYVTEALHALKQVGHPELEPIVRRVLTALDRDESIQPNWLGEFLVLAADVVGDAAWRAKEPQVK